MSSGSRLRLLAERNGEVYAVLGRECVQSGEELLSLGCVLAADDLVQTVDGRHG